MSSENKINQFAHHMLLGTGVRDCGIPWHVIRRTASPRTCAHGDDYDAYYTDILSLLLDFVSEDEAE